MVKQTEYLFQRNPIWVALARGYKRLRGERLSKGRLTADAEPGSKYDNNTYFKTIVEIRNDKKNLRKINDDSKKENLLIRAVVVVEEEEEEGEEEEQEEGEEED
ncbi:hypothetical protein HZH68_016099 [Vespula germanica]|uniref:Uncharacterized protein n=1 Tax=Vespula germanica TaxID=30212 RepID=A0A834J6C3_VESGE|nr:hypothetical protein HZH68_016099 [Vespula germanica]